MTYSSSSRPCSEAVGDVIGRDADPVQRLHPQHVSIDAAVGEDTGIGDAERAQVVGDEGGSGLSAKGRSR